MRWSSTWSVIGPNQCAADALGIIVPLKRTSRKGCGRHDILAVPLLAPVGQLSGAPGTSKTTFATKAHLLPSAPLNFPRLNSKCAA